MIRLYTNTGKTIAATRWRGTIGEIDLIFADGEGFIFVEVKKSRSFHRAAERLRPAQMRRIMASASEFLANQPKGQLTETRFDVALLNDQGECRILENALADV